MKQQPPPKNDQDLQVARLQYFLTWIIRAALFFLTLEAVVGITFNSPALQVSSAISTACVACFIIARRLARQGQIEQAIFLVAGTLLVTTLVGILVWNHLLLTVAMLPLIVVAVALPYLDGQRLKRLMIACWCVVMVVTVLGETLPSSLDILPGIATAFRVSSFITAITLFLLLLWQFSSRLRTTLRKLEAANRVLRRQEAAQRLLSEASMLLTSSLDYEVVLPALARHVVPALGDWCLIDLCENQQQTRRVAAATPGHASEDALRNVQYHYPSSWHALPPAHRALQKGQPLLLSTSQVVATSSPNGQRIPRQPAESAIVVPIIARGQTLGTITVVATQRLYTLEDLYLLENLAQRMASTIDTALLYATAQEAVRVRDQFLSIASHELKTPLTPLLAYTELLQRRVNHVSATAREQRAIQVIEEQALRLNKLIDSLLDLSRIQTGRLTIEFQEVDLVALARRVIGLMQQTTHQHTLQAMYHAESVLIEGDPLRLEQVLQNLLQNAIKYSPDGGAIVVEIGQDDQQAWISITDHGIGIPLAAQSRLFERFYRASNVDPQHISGFGIGLYVVREIVTLHGGSVEVASTEGSGTTFTLHLPQHQRQAAPV